MKSLLLLFILCFAFSCSKSQPKHPDPLIIPQHINWVSPQEGVKSLGIKHILIYVHGDYCSYCDLQDAVLDDPEVAAELNAHYVCIKTDQFPNVQYVPTMIWIMPDGKELFRVSQFLDKKHLLPSLKEISKHQNTGE